MFLTCELIVLLQGNFVEITLRHGCSTVNWCISSEQLFPRTSLDGCFCGWIYTKVIKIYTGYKRLKPIFNWKRMSIIYHVLTFWNIFNWKRMNIIYPVFTFSTKTHVFNVNGLGENVNLCLFHVWWKHWKMYKYLAVFSSIIFIQILVTLNPYKSVQV